MRLVDYNLETLLIEQIESYLAKPNTYDDLRLICLNLAPIQSIIEMVSTKIRHTAEAEKIQAIMEFKETDRNIQNIRHSMNQRCNQMIKQAEYDCYFLFLKQLESTVDHLALNHEEKNALKKIITSINQYLNDLEEIRHNDYLLQELQTTLQKSQEEYINKYNLTDEIKIKTKGLEEDQHVLENKLNTLQNNYNEQAQYRNYYTGYSLIGTTATTISGYFLIEIGIAATMPVLGIAIVSSAGAITLALLSTSIYSGIKSWYKHTEINDTLNAIKINQKDLVNANQTILHITEHELPAILNNQGKLEDNMICQRTTCEDIRNKALLAYQHASTIQTETPFSRPNSPLFFFNVIPPETASNDEVTQQEDLNDLLLEFGIF